MKTLLAVLAVMTLAVVSLAEEPMGSVNKAIIFTELETPRALEFKVPPGWAPVSCDKKDCESAGLEAPLVFNNLQKNAKITVQIYTVDEKSPKDAADYIVNELTKKQKAKIMSIWSADENVRDDFVYALTWEKASNKTKGRAHVSTITAYPKFFAIVLGYWTNEDNSPMTDDFIKFVYNIHIAREPSPKSIPKD